MAQLYNGTSQNARSSQLASTNDNTIFLSRNNESIVPQTIYFSEVNGFALDWIIKFCNFFNVFHRIPHFSEVSYDVSRSLEILMAAEYLKIDPIIRFITIIVAKNLPSLQSFDFLKNIFKYNSSFKIIYCPFHL